MRPDMSKRADQVAGMFGRVARGYDRTNTVLSGGIDHLWRAATVTAIAPRPGERVLDLAAGTGASSVAIAKKGAEVTALDFSAGMIEEGRRRHPEIRFVEGDAERLPFDDDSFEAVTISFGLRNVEHPQTALEEMLRVLVPGGRVVICEFSTPPRALIRAGYDLYLKHGLPLVARAVSSDPEAYLYLGESIDGWADQDVLAGWMRGVGFGRVAYRNLTGGIVALHRGRKPTDPEVLRSASARARRRHGDGGRGPGVGSSPANAPTETGTAS